MDLVVHLGVQLPCGFASTRQHIDFERRGTSYVCVANARLHLAKCHLRSDAAHGLSATSSMLVRTAGIREACLNIRSCSASICVVHDAHGAKLGFTSTARLMHTDQHPQFAGGCAKQVDMAMMNVATPCHCQLPAAAHQSFQRLQLVC